MRLNHEFILAFCFSAGSSVKTLPIWGAVIATSVVMTLPIALLFLAMKRHFIGGLTAGATKG